jgi:hypothetical protein
VILVVNVDLKQAAGSYTRLFDVLKSKDSWWHYLSATWLIATHDSPETLRDELVPLIFDHDRILITELSENYSGWLPKKAWEWIKKHR